MGKQQLLPVPRPPERADNGDRRIAPVRAASPGMGKDEAHEPWAGRARRIDRVSRRPAERLANGPHQFCLQATDRALVLVQ